MEPLLATSNTSLATSDNLPWTTRLSRTRISSVQGLSLSHAPDPLAQTLEDVLRTVQQLGLQRIAYDSLERQDQVGEGESFCVDRCLHGKTVVAVKHIKLDSLETDTNAFNRRLRTIINEIRIMHHKPLREYPNILSVVGYGWRTFERNPLPYIVVDYGQYGSLRQFLSENPRSFQTKVILAGDVAAGVTALHQCEIVHGDLKLDNVVVMQSWDRPPGVIAKICDFGHSVILAGHKKHARYYGTTIYNAPEIEEQEKYPIATENLVKCDIWAFALALWEILADGSMFFKKSWRSQASYERLWPTSLLSADERAGVPPVDGSWSLLDPTVSSKDSSRRVFGNFDLKYLATLGRDFVNSLNFGSAFVDKGCLRSFIFRALQVDPVARPSRILLGPLMSRWNPSDVNALGAKLALHTGSSSWSFDFLKPDQEKEIPWEQQRQIIQDFENLATVSRPTEKTAAAAFQVAMAYIVGFGTCKDMSAGVKFLKIAEDLSHPAARHFGPQLRAAACAGNLDDKFLYTTQLIDTLKIKPPEGLLTLSFPSSGNDSGLQYFDPSTFLWYECQTDGTIGYNTTSEDWSCSFEMIAGKEEDPADRVFQQDQTFQTFRELKQLMLSLRLDDAKSDQFLRLSEGALITSPGLKMNAMECAVAFNDIKLLKTMTEAQDDCFADQQQPNRSLLVFAFRTGNLPMVEALLDSNLPAFHKDENGCSIFHWLFMLEPDVSQIFPRLQGISKKQATLLNEPCLRPTSIHPQWPVKLEGSPLAFAIVAGSLSGAETLLRLGADPIAPIYSTAHDGEDAKWTPLHLAVKFHSMPMISLLISHFLASRGHDLGQMVGKESTSHTLPGAPWDRQTWRLATALAFEIIRKSADSQDSDLWHSEFGRLLSLSTPVERIAMHGHCANEHLAEVISILPQTCILKPSQKGSTALMQAIDFHDVAVVKALLNDIPILAKRPFRDPYSGQFTYPMHFASQVGSHRDADDALDIVVALFDLCPAHISIKDSKGRTPLHYSVSNTSARMTKWLVERGASVISKEDSALQTPLHFTRTIPNLKVLVDAGASLNEQDKTGQTLGHIAALDGHEHILKALLDLRAELEIKNISGETPLHCAVLRRSPTMVGMLLTAGLDVNARTYLGRLGDGGDTPLHYAAKSFRRDIVKLLVDGGAEVSITNSILFTPLHQCVFSSDEICLLPLLETAKSKQPSLINAGDLKQRTPLHLAALIAHAGLAQKLLTYGADATLRDEDGNTTFHLAAGADRTSVFKVQGDRETFCILLHDHLMSLDGGSVIVRQQLSRKNESGLTPWDIVSKENDWALMELIYSIGGFDVCYETRDVCYETRGPVSMQLLRRALAAEAWGIVELILMDQRFLDQHPALHYGSVTQLLSLARMSYKARVLELGLRIPDLLSNLLIPPRLSHAPVQGEHSNYQTATSSLQQDSRQVLFPRFLSLSRQTQVSASSAPESIAEQQSGQIYSTKETVQKLLQNSQCLTEIASLPYLAGKRIARAIQDRDVISTEVLVSQLDSETQNEMHLRTTADSLSLQERAMLRTSAQDSTYLVYTSTNVNRS